MYTKAPRNILVVCSELNVAGGLEKMVVQLANSLYDSGNKVKVLLLGNSDKSFYPIRADINIELLNINFGIGSRTNYVSRKKEFIQHIFALRKRIYQICPDIIISTEYPQTAALVAGQLQKRFKVISWQLSSYYQSKSYLWKKLSDYAYSKVHAIVCLNKNDYSLYKQFNKKAVLIPNYLSVFPEKSTLDKKKILTVARLVHIKGIDFLKQAVFEVLNNYDGWQWEIIGDGPLSEDLSRFIHKTSLGDRVILTPPSSHVLDKHYLASSIYVLTSRVESFGMVLLEAMAYGVPCVAFDCEAGPRHIITHNVDGFLVEKENPAKLVEAIGLLIKDEHLRKRMGFAAKKNVQRFSSNIVLKQWEELFQRISFSS